jgi:hypothetical protein
VQRLYTELKQTVAFWKADKKHVIPISAIRNIFFLNSYCAVANAEMPET